MKISKAGLSLIKKYEGIHLSAYKCPAGVWTIGYGHTNGVKQGDEITEEEADSFLRDDVSIAEDSVSNLVTVQLSQNQFDALVSFVFNLGTGNFKSSTLLQKLNSGDYAGAADEFTRWIYINKKESQGLLNRRLEEKSLFMA